MNWLLQVGGEFTAVKDEEDLILKLRSLFSQSSSVFALIQSDADKSGWEALLYKLLGLSTRQQGDSVLVLTQEGVSAVSFLDPDHNECVVVASGGSADDRVVRFPVGRGDFDRRPRSQCLDNSAALEVVLHFFRFGSRHPGFEYLEKGSRSRD